MMPMPSSGSRPGVSVIVSTAHRAASHVARLLAGLRDQPYQPLEVVLVVGPCPDDMRAFAESLGDVKVRFIPELNLAKSRNTGITMASGEILAFIDDDAVPSPLWLHELVEAFGREGPDCAGIGGVTMHANAQPHPVVQNRNALIHERGKSDRCVRLEPAHENGPDGPWFNRLHGCNMAFRRAAIEQVGGFDEGFIYQHEETDLCVRLIREGFRIVHHPRALVDHSPANSHFRRDQYDINYYNILRSYTYFALKHARGSFGAIAARSFRDHLAYVKWFFVWTCTARISPWRCLKFSRQWVDGFARGVQLGRRYRSGKAPQRPISGSSPREFLPLATAPKWEPPKVDPAARLRIALLCGEFGGESPGGVAVYTEHLAEGLARLGHEVTIFRSGYGPGTAKSADYRVVGIPPESDRPHAMSVLGYLRSLGSPCPFDVVESPLWAGEGAAVGSANIAPLVLRLETPLEVVRQTSGLPLTPEMIEGIASERLALSYASGVIAISRAIRATVEHVYEARLANHARLSRVIPIGLPDADSLDFEGIDGLDSGGVSLFYVGRLEARKGIMDLAQAFAEAARENPALRLWIAGSDNSRSDGHHARCGMTYEESMKSLWGPELSRRVRFLGRISEGAKNTLMARCDAFVAPSLYESFGIVFLEAMRQGKPVLGTRVGGIPEIVLDGETGLLVPPSDPRALASAMLAIATDAERRARLGGAGKARFLDRFTTDAFARESEAFYREVIAHHHGLRFLETKRPPEVVRAA